MKEKCFRCHQTESFPGLHFCNGLNYRKLYAELISENQSFQFILELISVDYGRICRSEFLNNDLCDWLLLYYSGVLV